MILSWEVGVVLEDLWLENECEMEESNSGEKVAQESRPRLSYLRVHFHSEAATRPENMVGLWGTQLVICRWGLYSGSLLGNRWTVNICSYCMYVCVCVCVCVCHISVERCTQYASFISVLFNIMMC